MIGGIKRDRNFDSCFFQLVKLRNLSGMEKYNSRDAHENLKNHHPTESRLIQKAEGPERNLAGSGAK